MKELYKKIIEFYDNGEKAALCTVVSCKGSTPLKESAKMLVTASGKTFGTIGGGRLENSTIEYAKLLIESGKPELKEIDLTPKAGSFCGGVAHVFIEPLIQKEKLLIFGGGHIGKAITRYCANLNFEITVVDDREIIVKEWIESDFRSQNSETRSQNSETGTQNLSDGIKLENNIKIILSEFIKAVANIEFDDKTYITIVTYDHKKDFDVLMNCVNKPHAYLGAMGSRNKVREYKRKLLDAGFSDDNINDIDMPIGLDIGAESADEIAVSIAAKLVNVRHSLKAIESK